MKIKNLFSKGKMNKDVDERLIPNGEFIEGYNIRVLNTSGSDAGAIENEKGNVKRTDLGLSDAPECIGSVADESKERLYWFVVNNLGHCYIYEYDVQNQITTVVLKDTRTGDDNVLNFSKKYKITGANVIYNTSRKNKLLLFTDGLNSPKMVNIERAKTYGANNFTEDDISLYKKPPFTPIVVTPFNTVTDSENSLKENFFAFAYRYKFLDNEYSATSSFTYSQFYPGEFDLNYSSQENEGMISSYNGYKLDYYSGDKWVTDIQLLFKNANDPTIYVIDNINKAESNIVDGTIASYEFFNKKIFKTLPLDEILRTFDDVPLTAKSQDIINDRIIFGNTTSQYDIVEEEGDDNTITLSYNAELESKSVVGNIITGSIGLNDQTVVFDLDGVALQQGNSIQITLALYSDQVVDGGDTYFNGSAFIQSSMILGANYSSVSDLCASDEFVGMLAQLSRNFELNVQTTPHPDEVSRTYGDIALSIPNPPTSTTFTLAFTSIGYDLSGGGTAVELYKYEDPVTLLYRESSNTLSLKSNRTYEVGMVYLDNYGRQSSVLLPSQNNSENQSEVFVPIHLSEKINSIKVSINHKAPYWARFYKFFIKTNKSEYYNIYATTYYEDGLDVWVLLQGANLKKVEEGQTLIVKSDNTGPLSELVRCRVLEVAQKNAADEYTDGEGWIEGNVNSDDKPIIEKSGTYMKIRPIGFSMNEDVDKNIRYQNKDVYGPYSDQGYIQIPLPSQTSQGFLQIDNEAALGTYIDNNIVEGSSVKFSFFYREGGVTILDATKTFQFKEEWVAQRDYLTQGTTHTLAKFLDAQTDFTYITQTIDGDVSGRRYTIPSDDPLYEFYLKIYRPQDGTKWRVLITTNERTEFSEGATLWAILEVTLPQSLICFETEPDEINEDIYYETEELFQVSVSKYHSGNIQSQTSSDPGIISLGVGNCFSFGNGVESIRVLDDRLKPFTTLRSRPNISLIDGYYRRQDENKIIYSGSYNENTGYNSLNEFNTSRGISKFMDTKYGSVQKLFARDSDLIVFQEDRVSKVLYAKNIINSPDGSGSLTQIEEVLGQDVPYAGEYGIAKNPESFAFYEGRVYFTDANRGAVLRLGNDGITPISYAGLRSFFKENLQQNRTNYNLGGFDPKYHQYVLSMSDDAMPVEEVNFSCGSQFNKRVLSSYDYIYKLSDTGGTATIDYTTDQEINITVVYNGTTYNNDGLTGSGIISFPVSESDLAITKDVSVQVTAVSSAANVSLKHTCPEPEELRIHLIVVNDPEDSSQTIVNRHKVGADGQFLSFLDVFSGEELSGVPKTTTSRVQIVVGYAGNGSFPNNGDSVVVQSFKNPEYHTGTFAPTNRMGYVVSLDQFLTPTQVRQQATYPPINTTTAPNGSVLNSMSFTFNRPSADEHLYLIWDYID